MLGPAGPPQPQLQGLGISDVGLATFTCSGAAAVPWAGLTVCTRHYVLTVAHLSAKYTPGMCVYNMTAACPSTNKSLPVLWPNPSPCPWGVVQCWCTRNPPPTPPRRPPTTAKK
eukprot:gene22155-biopygen2708